MQQDCVTAISWDHKDDQSAFISAKVSGGKRLSEGEKEEEGQEEERKEWTSQITGVKLTQLQRQYMID